MPELVGGKKSSADDSHVVKQDLVLFWESEPFIRLKGGKKATVLPVKTSSYFSVSTNCDSGCPVGRSGRGHPGARLLVFHRCVEAVVPGGFCNVILL